VNVIIPLKGYAIVNLEDMILELEESIVKNILLEFICPINKDVEYFLNYKAIEFSKQSVARTHLVFCSYKSERVLAAYFTLAMKFIQINTNALSNNYRHKIQKFGSYDPIIQKYIVSSPLIAQLGKNFKYKDQKLITGNEILKMACDKISEMQYIGGGKIAYLECEDTPKLKKFYEDNGFIEFGKRQLDKDEQDRSSGNYLVQMVKYLNNYK
jgi:hypothetical protein